MFNVGVLRPGEEERFPLDFQVDYEAQMATLSRPGATVSFTDGLGRRWRRDHMGRLRKEHRRLASMRSRLEVQVFNLRYRVRRLSRRNSQGTYGLDGGSTL